MDVDAHLQRIGAARPAGTSAADLAALHEAHVRTVPFEDYDIHLGTPISLSLDDLRDKIVRRRRGGFCYELNGIFAGLLRELGFEVVLMSAFEPAADGTRGADFDHLRLLVHTTDGPMLADVASGGSWRLPVPRRPGLHGVVRIEREGELWWSSEQHTDGTWARGWAWTEQPREMAEFTDRCLFQEHDPASHFVQRRLAVLPTPRGRVSLLNGVLTEVVDGARTDRELDAEQERAELAGRFGIVLDEVRVRA